MNCLRKLFGLGPRKETRAEFLADVERYNRLHREGIARANAEMEAKYEDQWVKQYANERKYLC